MSVFDKHRNQSSQSVNTTRGRDEQRAFIDCRHRGSVCCRSSLTFDYHTGVTPRIPNPSLTVVINERSPPSGEAPPPLQEVIYPEATEGVTLGFCQSPVRVYPHRVHSRRVTSSGGSAGVAAPIEENTEMIRK